MPGLSRKETRHVAIRVGSEREERYLRAELDKLLGGLTIYIQIATENSPGELMSIPVRPHLDVEVLVGAIKGHCPGFLLD